MAKRKPKGDGIRVTMVSGPVQCHTPVVRSDLEPGTQTFTLPYLWGSVTYRLSHVTNGVHVFEYEGEQA